MLTLAEFFFAFKRPAIPPPTLLDLDALQAESCLPKSVYSWSALAEQRLALLRNMIIRSNRVVVVIGEPGSGKTTMLHYLLATTDHFWRSARLRLKSVNHASGLTDCAAGAAVWLARGLNPPAVIVDDAHLLSRLELKVLLQAACDNGAPARLRSVILFAEPELRGLLADMACWLPQKSVLDKIFLSPVDKTAP